MQIHGDHEGLVEIDNDAFQNVSLTEIVLPSTLKQVGRDAFYGCKNLTKAILNEGLESIGANAFQKSGLSRIEIPPTVKIIRSGTFAFCNKLKNVILNKGLEEIEGGFEDYFTGYQRNISALFKDQELLV